LIDCHGNKTSLQQRDDFWLGKCRLTVEHTIVSGTAKRMTVHRPNEDRPIFRRRSTLGVQ
jgi:hypothetical protein